MGYDGGRQGIDTEFWLGNLSSNVHMGGREGDGRITLKCILER
jgi:hypothetical protein